MLQVLQAGTVVLQGKGWGGPIHSPEKTPAITWWGK